MTSTPRTKRTVVDTTVYNSRTVVDPTVYVVREPTWQWVWLDYLLDHTGERIQDHNWDDIIIHSTSWFEQVVVWTTRTKRETI